MKLIIEYNGGETIVPINIEDDFLTVDDLHLDFEDKAKETYLKMISINRVSEDIIDEFGKNSNEIVKFWEENIFDPYFIFDGIRFHCENFFFSGEYKPPLMFRLEDWHKFRYNLLIKEQAEEFKYD